VVQLVFGVLALSAVFVGAGGELLRRRGSR
jgi:hypothetical protein